jgi:hypothetical protein
MADQFAAALLEALEPWRTTHLDWYATAIGAMFQPVRDLTFDVGADGDSGYVPGWGPLLDPTLCPTAALPYLGQFVGVAVPDGADDATARAAIRAESGFSRGTLAAITKAVERSISTTWAPSVAYVIDQLVQHGNPPTVYKATANFTSPATFDTAHLAVVDIRTQYSVLERLKFDLTRDAYHLTLIVRPAQLAPANDTAALLAAVNAVKPAGIVLETVVTTSPRWQDATLTWAAVGGSVTWATVDTGQV